jgi:putative tricarboxylic transport membrane protein
VGRQSDAVAGLAFLALGIAACVEGGRLGFGSVHTPEPGFFPWLGGVMLVGLSLGLLVRGWRRGGVPASAEGEWARPAMLLAALVVYVPLLEPVGYPITTAALCAVALRILKTRSWWLTLAVSLALAVGTFLLFHRGLGVELPPGTLFSRG